MCWTCFKTLHLGLNSHYVSWQYFEKMILGTKLTCLSISILGIGFEKLTVGGGSLQCSSLMLLIHASNFWGFFSTRSIDGTCNVQGEPVFSVMVAGWFCEKSGWIGKVEDVKPVLLKKKGISIGNHFEEGDFYPNELWNRQISFGLIHLGPDIIWF